MWEDEASVWVSTSCSGSQNEEIDWWKWIATCIYHSRLLDCGCNMTSCLILLLSELYLKYVLNIVSTMLILSRWIFTGSGKGNKTERIKWIIKYFISRFRMEGVTKTKLHKIPTQHGKIVPLSNFTSKA